MPGIRTYAANALFKLAYTVGGSRMFNAPSKRGKVYQSLTYDQKDLISQLDHEELLSACRHIYNSFPMLAGAIDDKANTVSGPGWGPQFDGRDASWGDVAENWLINHFKIIDVRGRPFDMANITHLSSVTLDRDGEYFVYIFKTPSGYPLIQILESHRIGNRYHNTTFGNYQVRNGIAYDAYGRPVAYHFKGDTRELDSWLPARNIIHVYDPKWFSQGRGISPLVFGILDWLDVIETRDSEKVAQRIVSSIALKNKTPTGKPDSFTQRFGGTGVKTEGDKGHTSENLVEEFTSGQIHYLKFNAEDIEAFAANRPSVNQRAFEEAVLRGAFAGIGWTYEQAYDASKLGGASVRRDILKNQRSVERRQQVLMHPWQRIASYSIAVAIQNSILEPSADWYQWAPQLPAKMTADAGNEAKIEAEEFKLGFTTLRNIVSRRGGWWQDYRNQREIEADDLLTRAGRLSAVHKITLEKAINLMEMRSPNETAASAPDEQNTEETADA